MESNIGVAICRIRLIQGDENVQSERIRWNEVLDRSRDPLGVFGIRCEIDENHIRFLSYTAWSGGVCCDIEWFYIAAGL